MAKNVQEMADKLSELHDMNTDDAKSFVSDFFSTIADAVRTDKIVKVKGLGTFKIIDVQDRESINVNTGERMVISGHEKLSFIPETALKDLVNKPFAQFETVTLNEGVDLDASDDEDDVENKEELLNVNENVFTPEVEQLVKEENGSQTEETTKKEPVEQTIEGNDDVIDSEVKDQEQDITEKQGLLDFGSMEESNEEPKGEDTTLKDTESSSSDNIYEGNNVEIQTEDQQNETDEITVDDNDEEDAEEEKGTPGWLKWLLALLLLVLGCVIGYFVGSNKRGEQVEQPKVQEEVPVRKRVQQTSPDAPSVKPDEVLERRNMTEQTEEKPTAEEKRKEPEKVKKEASSAPDVAPAAPKPAKKDKPAEKVSQPSIAGNKTASTNKVAGNYNDNIEVRTGAYNIVGDDRTIVVKEGETLAQITKRTLGPGMECYIVARNGLSGNSAKLTKGQKIIIPKVEKKKKK